MFFILSKTLSYLILPFTTICLLLLTSVLVKNPKWKKRLFWSAFGLLMFFSNAFIANEIMHAWEIPARPYSEMRRYKLAIVLTGSTIPNLKPADRVYFSRGADRVTHTVQLFKKGLVERILISGGVGSLKNADEPEADKFKAAMILMGIPADSITIENQTRNTAESAIAVVPLLKAKGFVPKDCLLITSAFHMRRSLACYRKAGVDLDSFTTDFFSHERIFYFDKLFIPQLEAMIVWDKLFKEWVGMIAYKIMGYI
jgi:uncharacterized SAM-binding protein YcdF (DUF218 family)